MLINSTHYPDYAEFIMTLKCPLCGSQLDGNCHPNGSQLYCSDNKDEYQCGWVFGSDEYTYEFIEHTFTNYRYRISSRKISTGVYQTSISRKEIDDNNILKEYSRVEIFRMTGNRLSFFINKLDEETFTNKLKMYNVFS